jgi:hypothetical protein
MFAVGGAMLLEWRTAALATAIGVTGFVILRVAGREVRAAARVSPG